MSRNKSILILLVALFAFSMSKNNFEIIRLVMSPVRAFEEDGEPATLRQALAQVSNEGVLLPQI